MEKLIPELGKLITEPQHRDAIHIAVAPVTAGEDLMPGTRIGFIGNAFTVGKVTKDVVGIVDPFLTKKVKMGEQFYMFLMPNTITSLRHQWTHPAFDEEAALAELEPTFLKLKGPSPEEVWITKWAEGLGSTFTEVMDGADDWIREGRYLCRGGTFEGEYVPEEFWEKYEVVKKCRVEEKDRSSFFTCSC